MLNKGGCPCIDQPKEYESVVRIRKGKGEPAIKNKQVAPVPVLTVKNDNENIDILNIDVESLNIVWKGADAKIQWKNEEPPEKERVKGNKDSLKKKK